MLNSVPALLVRQPYCSNLAAGIKTVELRNVALGIKEGDQVGFVECGTGAAPGCSSFCRGVAVCSKVSTTNDIGLLEFGKIFLTQAELASSPARKYQTFWSYEFRNAKTVSYTHLTLPTTPYV